MSFQISPFGNDQFFDINGVLAVGYKLFTYLDSSSTKEPVYADVNGATPQTNPIILNSIGMPSAPLFINTAKRYKFVFTGPTDTDPPASPLYTANGVDVGFNTGGVPAVEWVLGTTPTYLSATSFSLVGDQTAIYTAGRRVQCLSSLGTFYGTVSTGVFGAVTTVTLLLDAGALDATLSSVFYGFLSALGSSWPAGYTTGLATTLNGNLTVPPASNFNLLPVGMQLEFAGAILPAGYLWCNGAAVSRTTYPSLFGAIGTSYGAGDGVTTFNVPDRRGRFGLGLDNMGGLVAGRVTSSSVGGANAVTLGGTGGEQTHVTTLAETPTHSHGKNLSTGALQNSDEAGATNTTSVKRADFSVITAGGGAAHNTMPPWIAGNVMIRYA